jgi:hypothetical protein
MMAVLSEFGIAFSAHTTNPIAIPSNKICMTINGHVKAVGL